MPIKFKRIILASFIKSQASDCTHNMITVHKMHALTEASQTEASFKQSVFEPIQQTNNTLNSMNTLVYTVWWMSKQTWLFYEGNNENKIKYKHIINIPGIPPISMADIHIITCYTVCIQF